MMFLRICVGSLVVVYVAGVVLVAILAAYFAFEEEQTAVRNPVTRIAAVLVVSVGWPFFLPGVIRRMLSLL